MTKDYIEFQDRGFPLAYFISFRCYGTWLHGDERGTMDRKKFNIFGTPKMPVNLALKQKEFSVLKSAPFSLNEKTRSVVENAIREVCKFRGYGLLALQARTNHVHCVVSANIKPELIMNTFKSYATRHLRIVNLVSLETKLWSRHGSTRYLWTEKHIEFAIDYVMNGQGDELPKFE
jgi:REP element-mobilizing transposase RayT